MAADRRETWHPHGRAKVNTLGGDRLGTEKLGPMAAKELRLFLTPMTARQRTAEAETGPGSVSNVLCDVEEATQPLWVLVRPY